MSKHLSALFALLPRGDIYPNEGDGSTLENLFLGISDSLDEFESEAFREMSLAFPDQVGSYLEDWEKLLGLPFPGVEGLSREERKNVVVAMLTTWPESSKSFFEWIASVFGYEIEISIDDYPIFRAGSPAGAQVNGERLHYVWKVSLLDSSGRDLGLESIINFFKPAHTYVIYKYI